MHAATMNEVLRYRYSNIGYWLLGRVIEEASGQPFTAYVADRVLRPLGIDAADLGYRAIDPAQLASGYLEKYSGMNVLKPLVIDRSLVGQYCGPWLEIRGHYPNGPAFGGLVGTAAAFASFLQDQLCDHSRLFSDRTRALFYEQQRTHDGTTIEMTLGWHIGRRSRAEDRFFYKEGGGGGFRCLMRLYPGRGMASVLMANATSLDVHALLESVDSHLALSARI
jgi:D-alanyl-D-alanine carboxypeptidase